VRGEVTVLLESGDEGDFGRGVLLRAGERDLEVRSARPYRDRGLIVAFAGIADRNAAEALRGLVLTRDGAQRRSLDEGEYWSADLVGLEAVTPAGAVLGRVAEVVSGGFQDRLVVVTPSDEEVHVPFVDEIVGDPHDGRIVIDAPEGLFPG
jgi:16S rRNA processing protein RimM